MLNEAIKTLGTQAEVGQRLGVAQTTVGCWMRGETLPTNLAIPALAAALGIPESDLRAQIATERAARAAAKATP